MRKTLALFLLLATSAFGRVYYSKFETPQNPISENGNWANGLADGLQWGNVQVSGGIARGTTVSGAPPFNDSFAVVKGTWGNDQQACGTVFISPSLSRNIGAFEIEIHLRRTVTANSSRGYEFLYSLKNDGSQYAQMVFWPGPLNTFTVIVGASGVPPALASGDVLCATVSGSSFSFDRIPGGTGAKVNILNHTDTNIPSGGSPGMGFFNQTGGSLSDNALFGFSAYAATDQTIRNAASCSQANVQSAITSAVAGDVVWVPSCTATSWASTVSVSGKALTLLGQSSCTGTGTNAAACVDNTNIVDATGTNALTLLGTSTANFVDVSGFTFLYTSTATKSGGIIGIDGTMFATNSYRIHDNHFNPTAGSTRGIDIVDSFGLIDHNFFDVQTLGNVQSVATTGSPDGSDGGFTPWNQPLTLGSINAVYEEDNSFKYLPAYSGDSAIDNYGGARYVNRHNYIENNEACSHHGTDSGNRRSAFSFECYQNTVLNSGGSHRRAGTIRGGTGVWWGNTYNVSGAGSAFDGLTLMVYRACSGSAADVSGWHNCTGTQWQINSTNFAANGSRTTSANTGLLDATHVNFCSGNKDLVCTSNTTCSAAGAGSCTTFFDQGGAGSQLGTQGYQCRDQPGMTHGQVTDPIYGWSNTGGGSIGAWGGAIGTVCGLNDSGTSPTQPVTFYIASGRDFIDAGSANTPKPGYSPFIYPHPLQGAAPPAPAVSIVPGTQNLGSVAIGSTSAVFGFTLTNTGTAPLLITSIGFTGTNATDFGQSASSTCGSSLAQGLSCSINVTFTPTAVGARSALLTIADNATGSPQTAALTGTGTVPGQNSGGDNRYCGTGNVANFGGSFDGPAALPQNCLNTAMANTPSGGTVRQATTSATLSSAISASVCGDIIEIPAGTSIVGTFGFTHAGTCDDAHWITVRSSGISDPTFPPEGSRVSPCQTGLTSYPNRPSYPCPSPASLMAMIQGPSAGSNPVTTINDHWRFIGIKFTRAATGDFTGSLVSLANTATKVIFDRVWVAGIEASGTFPQATGSTTITQRGIGFGQSNNVAVIDSYFTDLYCEGSRISCDAQSIAGGFGSTANSGWGTYKIVNNHIEGAAEGTLFGGANGPPDINIGSNSCSQKDVPKDFEYRRNEFFKPLTWFSGDILGSNVAGWPIVKNGFEFKNGCRILVEGNTVTNAWPGFSQPGQAIVIAPKNQSNGTPAPNGVGTCPSCIVTDITVRYNYTYNTMSGIGVFNSADSQCVNTPCPPLGFFRGSIHDNIVDKTNLPVGFTGNDNWEITTITNGPMDSLTLNHNTSVVFGGSNGARSMWELQGPSTPNQTNFVITNNIGYGGSVGMIPAAGGGCMTGVTNGQVLAAFNACSTPYTYSKNLVTGTFNQSLWPTGNFFATSGSTVGFTNFNNGDTGNYQLLNTSAIYHQGTDGLDVGANVVAVTEAVQQASIVALVPFKIDFGGQAVGSSTASQAIVLTNMSSLPLNISSVSITGTNIGDFSQNNNCGASVASGASCTVNVTFSPTTSGTRVAIINVADNNSTGPEQIPLSGIGTAGLQLAPASLGFGNQRILTTSPTQGITLTNISGATISISSITVTGANATDFTIQSNTCGATLAASGNCSVTIAFTPASTGSRSAALTVVDSAQGSPHSAGLTGTGIVPGATLTPATLTFATQAVGTSSASQPATLLSSGTDVLTISTITITGDYSQTNNCPATLNVGASCTINVTFSPTVAGTRTGTLTVNSNDPTSPDTTSLTGLGAAVTNNGVIFGSGGIQVSGGVKVLN